MNYKVTQEQLEQFARIYNTMGDISTKGENTLLMAGCLQAMKEVVETVSKQIIPEEKNDEVKE